jgi:hypothetical protein
MFAFLSASENVVGRGYRAKMQTILAGTSCHAQKRYFPDAGVTHGEINPCPFAQFYTSIAYPDPRAFRIIFAVSKKAAA